MEKKDGLYLYALNSSYNGDDTKCCGLTGVEIDSNFLFLRGNDIKNGYINNNCLILNRYNNTSLVIYGLNNGNISGEKIISDGSLTGDGTLFSPLKISNTFSSGFIGPIKKIINIMDGETLPDNPSNGDRYLTIEQLPKNKCYYNYFSMLSLNTKIVNETKWRVPTITDWGEMLNALEKSEYSRNHLNCQETELGCLAGLYIKSDDEWVTNKTETEETSIFDAKPSGFIDNNELKKYGEETTYFSINDINDTNIWVRKIIDNRNSVTHAKCNVDDLFSIRLVRDIEENENFNQFENICGVKHEVIRMPSVKIDEYGNIIEKKEKLWIKENSKIIPPEIKNGNFISLNENSNDTFFFILNHFDGNNWIKRIIPNNFLFILENDGENMLHHLTNGKIIKLNFKEQIDSVNQELVKEINDLKKEIEILNKNVITKFEHDDDIKITVENNVAHIEILGITNSPYEK